MSQKLMGRKCGMTQRFDKEGNVVPCTVIEVTPNVITKIIQTENYCAVQTAAEEVRSKDPRRAERILKKPLAGQYKKVNLPLHRFQCESRLESIEGMEVGQKVDLSTFSEGSFVDVIGTTKGKGFQGVMKLHGFAGGPAAHGSGFHRHAGSTGMRSTPGICFKGGKRASQMGNRRQTKQNVLVLAVDVEKNLLILKGNVPGNKGSMVKIQPAVKKTTGKRS